MEKVRKEQRQDPYRSVPPNPAGRAASAVGTATVAVGTDQVLEHLPNLQ